MDAIKFNRDFNLSLGDTQLEVEADKTYHVTITANHGGYCNVTFDEGTARSECQ